jgi:hypothetical protein
MRHVRANSKLRRRPAFPWTRRSAVRVADGCAGLLAAHIADKKGLRANGFLQYANSHLGRALTPTYITTSKQWLRAIGWRKLPAILRAISAFGRYVRTPDLQASPEEREAYVRRQFSDLLKAISPGIPDAASQPVISELVGKILATMNASVGDSPSAETQPDPRRATGGDNVTDRSPDNPAGSAGQPSASND